MKIILGFSSKSRREVLKQAGYIFEVINPDIDEKAIRTDDLYQLSLLVAKAKAAALLAKISEPALLITADQIVVCHGNLYEKPTSEDEARNFLNTYSAGHPAETVSALVVTNTETKKVFAGVEVAKVFFNPIPAGVIEEYIKAKTLFAHAGGFSPNHELVKPYIRRIEGTLDSVMGLPLKLLEELIAKAK